IDSPEPKEFDLPLVGLAANLPVVDGADEPSKSDPLAATDSPPMAGDGSDNVRRSEPVSGGVDDSRTDRLSHTMHDDSLRWLPWIVTLVIGAVVAVSGVFILRRQETN